MEELRQSVMLELDYEREAQNLKAMLRNLEGFDRLYVPQPIENFFTKRVLTMEYVAGTKITALGPLASEQQVNDVDAQVRHSVAAGARLLTGGHRVNRPGFFYAPTVLADVPPAAAAFHEEIFGPVASIFRVPDAEAAIALANGSRFGLGASVWTNDMREAERIALEIESGAVFVNAMVASDPRFPFGGVKASGYGRELGAWGLREFTNVKTVRMKAGGPGTGVGTDTE